MPFEAVRFSGPEHSARRAARICRYPLSARPGAAPIWWQEWQGQRSLPALVRMRVGFPPDDGRRWPELIVGLMVDLPPPSQL